MAQYGTIDITTWGDRKFRALSAPPPCAQVLWLYLLAPRERCLIPGLIPAGVGTIAESLRWPYDAASAAFAEIEVQGMAQLDTAGPLIWLPNALAHNEPRNQHQVTGWGKAWAEIPECPLKRRAWLSLGQYFAERGEQFATAFRASFPEPPESQSGGTVPPTVTGKRPRNRRRNSPEDRPSDSGGTHQHQHDHEQEAEAAAARASACEAAAPEAGGEDGAVLSGPGKLAECQAPPSPPVPPAAPPAEQIPAVGEAETTAPRPQASASPKPMLVDDEPVRHVVVEDVSGTPDAPEPYAAARAFRRAAEAKYRAPRRYIANLTLPEFSELDELVRWVGGVEAAVAWFAERPADAKNATSLRYFLTVFADERRKRAEQHQPAPAPVTRLDDTKAARWWEWATGIELGSFLRRRQELHPLLDEQAPLGLDQVEVDGKFVRSEGLVALHAEFRALVEARAASNTGKAATA